MSQWYRIDNTGKIFHAVSSSSNSAVFRVSMVLTEMIDPVILQDALDVVATRFPSLMLRVRKGLFWDFLEQNDAILEVKKETDYPCAPIERQENNAYLIRVLYFNNRISVEVFHSLTDGGGAEAFIKTLTYQYLKLKGNELTPDESIMLPSEEPLDEEVEDSFVRYATDSRLKGLSAKDPKSYQILGTPLSPRGINLVQGQMASKALNTYAKSRGTSLTGLLTSVLIQTIFQQRHGINESEIVTVAIPVSLRKAFPSRTIRNFFSVSNISVRVTEETSMDDIIKEVTDQLIQKTEKSYLQEGIDRFFSFQKNPFLRIVPVFIKYPIMRFAFNWAGESRKTLTLTNLGNVKLPDSMRPYVKYMDIVLYPTKKSPINCGVATVNDTFTITFARAIEENDLIKEFFKNISDMTGLKVTVQSDEWGE